MNLVIDLRNVAKLIPAGALGAVLFIIVYVAISVVTPIHA